MTLPDRQTPGFRAHPMVGGEQPMSNSELTAILCILLLLVGMAQLLGYLFVKLRQPKVVGEIVAGVVLGPALLGHLPAVQHLLQNGNQQGHILSFVYWLGLLLLMFLSGAETRQLFTREERREVGWLTIVGTGLPFRAGTSAGTLADPACPVWAERQSPVAHHCAGGGRGGDVGAGGLEDFCRSRRSCIRASPGWYWAWLSLRTSFCGWLWRSQQPWRAKRALDPRAMSYHLLATVAFFALGLTIVPRMVKRINKSRFNVMAQQSPVAYAIAVLLVYCVVAGALGVSLVFAAFLAGFAVVHKKRQTLRRSAGRHRQGLVRLLHSGVLRDRRSKARPRTRPVAVDVGGISRRKLRGEGALGLAGGALRRLSRSGPAEPCGYHECAWRAGHRAGQRCLRGGDHQRHLLHYAWFWLQC